MTAKLKTFIIYVINSEQMSICNLFTELYKPTGNILMFSQYSRDLTKGNARDEAYKVIPSKFIAMDIDYDNVNVPAVGNSKNLNVDIPTFFQNFYENACAYSEVELESFTPNNARGLFWNAMDIAGMIGVESPESDETDEIVVDDTESVESTNFKTYSNNYVRYIGDINIESFNEYNGMGYSEVYCYIPTDYDYSSYTIEYVDGEVHLTNPKSYIEGYNLINENINKDLAPYSKDYYYNANININTTAQHSNIPDLYNINTIVVLYDVWSKASNGEYIKQYERIPMALYFTGNFDSTGKMTNIITKYMNNEDAYGMGTSYGLRICTRFTVTPNNINISNIELSSEGSDHYSAFCQVMTKMSENIDKMNNVISSSYRVQQNMQDILAVFKNNRINTPYIREVGGKSYWFVNGKLIGESTLIESVDILQVSSDELQAVTTTLINKLND